MLSRMLQSWLLATADPTGPAAVPPRRAMPPGMLRDLLTLADRHGVLPAVVSNLKAVADRQGLGRILRLPASGGGEATRETSSSLAAAERVLAGRVGLALMLRSQWAEIRSALAEVSLPVVVLKGPEFADRLYPRPALRTFTDLDLLVPPEAAPEAARRIGSLGYRCTEPGMKYDRGYGEISFRRSDAGGVVELHTNLVNSPLVREGVSVAFDDLQFAGAGGDAAAARLSAAALLAIAAVHGAASHGFDRLQILCDVAQAVRGAAGDLDETWLAAFAGRGRAGLCLATALDLAERLLGEARCRRLRERLGLRVPRSVRLLLTRGVVLRAHAYIDSFRRQAFREMLKKR